MELCGAVSYESQSQYRARALIPTTVPHSSVSTPLKGSIQVEDLFLENTFQVGELFNLGRALSASEWRSFKAIQGAIISSDAPLSWQSYFKLHKHCNKQTTYTTNSV